GRRSGERLEPHQDRRVRPADECSRERRHIAQTGGGQVRGDTMKGGLRLQGSRAFANMVITPDAVDGLSPEPARDPLDGDRGLVRNWRLSKFSALPNGKEPIYNEMPGASHEWKTISTERNGRVNLSREYGRPRPGRTEP